MAALSDADRQIAARNWIHKAFVEANATATFTYTDIKAAADATDAWIDSNQGSYNSALSAPFSGATVQQKTLLFCVVALRRAGLL
jgi:hypothetical protein